MGKSGSKLNKDVLNEIISKTYYDEKEVKQWWKGFCKDCPEKVITYHQFFDIYLQYFPKGYVDEMCSLVFKAFDTNKDGMVDFKEFMYALSITSRGRLDEKLNWVFDMYDIQKEGYLTRSQITKVISFIDMLKGSPLNTTENIYYSTSAISIADRLFDKMDLDQDGVICREEFIKYMSSDADTRNFINGLSV